MDLFPHKGYITIKGGQRKNRKQRHICNALSSNKMCVWLVTGRERGRCDACRQQQFTAQFPSPFLPKFCCHHHFKSGGLRWLGGTVGALLPGNAKASDACQTQSYLRFVLAPPTSRGCCCHLPFLISSAIYCYLWHILLRGHLAPHTLFAPKMGDIFFFGFFAIFFWWGFGGLFIGILHTLWKW